MNRKFAFCLFVALATGCGGPDSPNHVSDDDVQPTNDDDVSDDVKDDDAEDDDMDDSTDDDTVPPDDDSVEDDDVLDDDSVPSNDDTEDDDVIEDDDIVDPDDDVTDDDVLDDDTQPPDDDDTQDDDIIPPDDDVTPDDDDATCIPTKEICDGLDNDCDNETDNFAIDPCDNGFFCDGREACVAGKCENVEVGPDCGSITDECNTGVCDEDSRSCVKQQKPNGTGCDDGFFCNVGETCQSGVCQGGSVLDCSSFDDECSAGVCEEEFRGCVAQPKPVGAACGDASSSSCDDADACDGKGVCEANHQPSGASCDDGLFCNQGETCDGSGACVGGNARDCSALTDECNTGVCDDTADACIPEAKPNGTACGSSSSSQCNQPDTCQSGVCSSSPVSNGTSCDDGLFCTVGETCQNGSCQGGSAKNCNDGLFCTGTETCNEASDQCVSSGNPCPGTECKTCQESTDSCFDSLGTSCGSSSSGTCDNPDACDGAGNCLPNPAPSGTVCDDGLYCNTGETCNGLGGCNGGSARDCSSAGDECNTGVCDDTADACIPEAKPNGTACGSSSSSQCNQPDTCQSGVCEANLVGVGVPCNDGLYCNVGETCNGLGGCNGGSARDCSAFADECNTGLCNEAGDTCYANPVNEGGGCDDGDVCTSGSTCQSGSCFGGTVTKDTDSDTYIDDQCPLGNDCDDGVSSVYPGAADMVGDGVDKNCDGVDGVDADQDGYASVASGGTDCDDNDPNSHPGATELCDGNDNACAGSVPIDEGDGDGDLYVECSSWSDTQGDDPTILGGGDCDDALLAVHPNAPDPLDTVDQNCDGFDGESVSVREFGRKYLQIALDSQEKVWIMGGAWLSNNVSGTWTNQVWQSAAYTDFVLDSADHQHASYQGADGLRYAYFDGLSWTSTLVDGDDPQTGESTSIALDDVTGNPCVSYRGASGDLRVACFDGAAWSIEVADATNAVDHGTSLVIQGGLMKIATFKLAPSIGLYLTEEQAGGGWTTTLLDVLSGDFNSMAADGAGKLHISSWYSNGFTCESSLRMTSNVSGSFESFHMDAVTGCPINFGVGLSSSLALDSFGKRHVLYLERNGGGPACKVKYATDKDGVWKISVVGNYPCAEETNFITAITVDSADQPLGAYYGSGTYCANLCYVK